ncbi:MAG: alkaline phosphatase [Nitrospirae bacterium]|nr:alkaline phosphatase [Nitrospirota bacterium]
MRKYPLNRINWGILAFEPLCMLLAILVMMLFWESPDVYGQEPVAKYIILMIADGWGAKQIEAANQYCTNEGTCDATPTYQDPDWNPGGALWKKEWISTYSYGGSYNTNSAWSTFNYVLTGAVTDSAAAASVLYSGTKTDNDNVSVSHNDIGRLFTIGEKAKDLGKGVGAVTTVPLSDATPGAWVAHNNDRSNSYAIADEGFFGDPNTTGTGAPGNKYEGSHGPTLPPADVLIGDARSNYVNSAIRTELQAQHNLGNLYYVNCPSTGGDPAGADGDSDGINDDGDSSGVVGDNPCIGGNTVNCDDNCVNTSNAAQADSDSDGYGDVCDCQQLLMSAANSPGDMRIAGLFERPCTALAGCYTNNPTLSESLTSALTLLGDTTKFPNGAIFMFEGGAVDWAGHSNDMESLVKEMRDFNNAVDTVINWVNDGTNGSDWTNTMVIVTGDHECGYLTPKSGIFPDQPLGLVNNDTIKVTGSCSTDKKGEKIVSGSGGRRASWNDLDCDNLIDTGETVYWAWNSGGHSNSLIPLYCRGVGCNLFSNYYETTQDLKRGYYLDNRHVWSAMNTVLIDVPLLSAPTVMNIDMTSATLGATIDYDSESTITERGTVWDISSSPVANQLAEGGTAVGVFSHSRTGLPEGSLIYYRGHAVNTAGTGYSPEGSFNTEPIQVSNAIMSTVSDTSMHIGWTDNSANSSEAIILMKAGAPVDAAPVDGSPYIANSILGSGEQLGTGNYVIFAGTGSQADVTGLIPWTTYHIAVYAYAGAATMINYQQSSPVTSSRGSCTDADGDTYAIEGGGCGQLDCNDNNILISPAASETCNNIDDNCNGTVDEGLTQPTSCGIGACAATGIETCTAGVWGGDTCTPGTPTSETCNNIDDNCNGTVDEGLTQPTSCGVGACASTGIETGTAGVWGSDTCTPGTPTSETCNNIDDNCNGTVDEDLTQPTSCGVGACAATGIETCTAGVWGGDTCTPGTPTSETCNNIDDNCNGTVDENLTQPTSCGVGACASTGIETCTAGVWGGDTCTPGTPTSETCNNIDDNCNGTVDEDLTQPTSCGIGACAATGIETCTAGVWGGDTCTPGTPTSETCNNIDDNCNGTVDEGLTQPAVSTTVPTVSATGVPLNSSATINWDKNVNCETVNTTNIISDSPGWEFNNCIGNQAVFTSSGQSGETTYTVSVTTAVTDTSGCAMATTYQFSFRTNVSTTLFISEPDGIGDTITAGDPYNITYTLDNPDKTVNTAFYYDTDNVDMDGTAITGACAAAPEGAGVTCMWDTTGMSPGVYYIYGISKISGSGLTHIWTGGGADTLASNAANWSDNSAPQNGDDVIFNGTSVKDCSWDITVPIHSISLNSGYAGTVTVNTILSMTGDSIISDGRLVAGDTVFYGNGLEVYSIGPITIN